MSNKKFYMICGIICVLIIVIFFRSTNDISYIEKNNTTKTAKNKDTHTSIESSENTSLEELILQSLAEDLTNQYAKEIKSTEKNNKTDPFGKKDSSSENLNFNSQTYFYREAIPGAVISHNLFEATIDGETKLVKLIGLKDGDYYKEDLEQLLLSTESIFIEFDLKRYDQDGIALGYVWLSEPSEDYSEMINYILLKETNIELDRLTSPNIKYTMFFAKAKK